MHATGICFRCCTFEGDFGTMTEVILGIVKAPAYATTIKDFCAEYQIDMGKLTAQKLFCMSSPSEASPNIGDLLYRRSEIYGGRGFAERPHRPLVLRTAPSPSRPSWNKRPLPIKSAERLIFSIIISKRLNLTFSSKVIYLRLVTYILTPRNLYTYQRES